MAFQSLASNKVRAMLTMLGIIIGVGSVITMTAIGQGAQRAVSDRIGSMGINMLQIDPAAVRNGGLSTGSGGSQRLTEADAVALRKCDLLDDIASSVDTRIQAVAGNLNWATRIVGTTPKCLAIRNYEIGTGSLFSEGDARIGTKVCVLGKTVVTNLFGEGADPIGKTIRIKSLPFSVIGVLQEKGANANGQDQDDIIFAPLSTVQKKIMGTTWLEDIFVSTVSREATEEAKAQVIEILRQQHRILPGQDNDFRIRSQVELAQAADQSSAAITSLLSSAAIISLLVGGIGIMNIMLVSVTERTREIGIRKSIGAKRFDILFQFLTEAVTLSFAGGLIGIAVGWVASSVVSKQNGWILSISPSAVLLSFGAAAFVGIFFGWYPARKAAGLNPIEALRYD